ncbi:signal transduction histidine kinase [Nonlabens ulvanivorans]|uniref:Signal transduction histidine kinase n=1 Tax=Nonlabens ulvanivorans TaxID=906888 RepID=A0A090WFX9_NONUL|nr:hypothetical protein [Nonlabens ulvanivorans]GAL74319.1 signal transduction histidine kinase [Nonlabens ulvanivorans]
MDDLRKPLSFSVGKGDYLKIGIIILVVFIICLIVLLSLGFASLFTNSDTSTDNDTLSWMSGALGGLISIVLALFTFLAFYVQYLANQKIQNQFREQQANEHFHKMLELHKSNIDEFSIKSHDKEDIRTTEIHTHGNLDAIIKTVDSKSLRSNNYQTRGRRCFILMLNDLHYSIQLSFQVKAANRLVLKDELVLKLAYRIFFLGGITFQTRVP